MDNLIKEALVDFNRTSELLLIDGFIVFTITIILSLIIAKVYMLSHKGYSYIRSFAISIVLVSLITSLIMLIIGSNIARAFALVGAMSIIRFRNPVKDSKDLVFIFASIAVGMACGTQFYSFAILFVLFFSILNFVLETTNFGQITRSMSILKVTILQKDFKKFDELIKSHSLEYNILSSELVDENLNIVLECLPNKKNNIHGIINLINSEIKIFSHNILMGDDSINS